VESLPWQPKKDEIAIKENAAEKRARECERQMRMGILRSNIQIEISAPRVCVCVCVCTCV